jgi:hypothetical protein
MQYVKALCPTLMWHTLAYLHTSFLLTGQPWFTRSKRHKHQCTQVGCAWLPRGHCYSYHSYHSVTFTGTLAAFIFSNGPQHPIKITGQRAYATNDLFKTKNLNFEQLGIGESWTRLRRGCPASGVP